jgi:hypothetical protein
MKVIFLDHDGVICLSRNWGGRAKKWSKYRSANPESSSDKMDAPVEVRFDDFDEKAIRVLNKILEETGAEIVVSSDWKRWANVEEMGEYYEAKGISKKPIDFTPDLGKCTWYTNEVWVWLPKWDAEMSRVIEIKQYLHDHPEITHWVAVDDLFMGRSITHDGYTVDYDWGLTNFVHTPRSNEGIKQSGVKEKILKFLQ